MTDFQDQPDGFHSEVHKRYGGCNHPECADLEECSHALEPQGNSCKGPIPGHTKDVYDLTHAKIGFRLAKGFSLLLRSER